MSNFPPPPPSPQQATSLWIPDAGINYVGRPLPAGPRDTQGLIRRGHFVHSYVLSSSLLNLQRAIMNALSHTWGKGSFKELHLGI